MKKLHSFLFFFFAFFSLNSFANDTATLKDLTNEVQQYKELHNCLQNEHKNYITQLEVLDKRFSEVDSSISSNKSFFKKDGEYNQKGLEALLKNDIELANGYLELRFNYISEVATCLSSFDGVDLDNIANEMPKPSLRKKQDKSI